MSLVHNRELRVIANFKETRNSEACTRVNPSKISWILPESQIARTCGQHSGRRAGAAFSFCRLKTLPAIT